MSKNCPACHAELSLRTTICEYCGSPVHPVALTYKEREQIRNFANKLNKIMLAEQEQNDEFTRKIIFYSTGLVFLALVLLRLLWKISWVDLAVVGCIAIVLLIITTIFFNRDRLQKSYDQAYYSSITPQITEFLQEKTIPRWQFDNIAHNALLDEDPMRRYFLSGKVRGE